MQNIDKPLGSRQLSREILQDGVLLGRLAVNHVVTEFRIALRDEGKFISKIILRVLIVLPLMMMGSLFAGAAAIEWLSENVMITLTTVYLTGAALFIFLAVVIALLPVRPLASPFKRKNVSTPSHAEEPEIEPPGVEPIE